MDAGQGTLGAVYSESEEEEEEMAVTFVNEEGNHFIKEKIAHIVGCVQI